MFRLWAKIFKDNRLIRDCVIEKDEEGISRTNKVFQSIDEVCYKFDLSKPIWLNANVEEFKKLDKTRFTNDNFIDTIDFDNLEIHIIEED